jgi:hypothetical protein
VAPAGGGTRVPHDARLDGPVDRRALITPAAGSDSQQSHETTQTIHVCRRRQSP